MRWLVALALLSAGCSWTFDGDAPEVPLLGSAPDTDSLPHLNQGPADSTAEVVYGTDGRPWAIFDETLDMNGDLQEGMRAVRLEPPGLEETLVAEDGEYGYDHFYLLNSDPAGMPNPMLHLTIQALPRDGNDVTFDLPLHQPLLIPGPGDRLFLYWAESSDTTEFLIQWVDKSFSRMIPVLPGIDPGNPSSASMFFSSDGLWLYTQDGNNDLVKHSTTSEVDLDLGVWSRDFGLDGDHFVVCGDSGLRTVPTDGSMGMVLDPSPCDKKEPLYFHGSYVLYTVNGTLRQTLRNGTGTPTTVLDMGERVIAFGPQNSLAYSRDPAGKYAAGAGDGWIGDWRFMDRGRAVSYSRDGKKVRWLEHAAQASGIGELLSATVPNGDPLHLALNVRQYEELSDGRVLACSNRVFRGVQNRVIAIDEEKKTAVWVASAGGEFANIPGTTDILVDVVTGPSSYDIVRVPIPPKN